MMKVGWGLENVLNDLDGVSFQERIENSSPFRGYKIDKERWL